MAGRLLAIGVVVVTALLLAASGTPRAIKEGGTFRVAVLAGFFDTIDPALVSHPFELLVLEPTCGTLMTYPSKPPPAGLEIAPELAAGHPVVSKDGRTYTFTIRKDARFSDGKPVTARAFARAIERILDPAMKATLGSDFAALIVGGEDVLAGKTKSLAGLTTKGRVLTLRLTRRELALSDNYISGLCAVPPTLPVDPEGVKAPLPSAAPYYVGQYLPGERLVLERNRFYKGVLKPHVSRYAVDLNVNEGSIIDDIATGKVDTGYVTVTTWAERAAELARRYGRNKTQFWVTPGGGFLRMFVLNTSRPLFRNNPKLRQAVNFAVDRKALTRELGPPLAATPMDQYLRLRDEKIYPLTGPDPPHRQEARQGTDARRQGRPLHAARCGRRGPGADTPEEPESDRNRCRDRR
jgi:ABC-type oligopeptide transport system substrate-binding subunit